MTQSAKLNSPDRSYDVVLYGATGFVGRQTVAYFAQHVQGLRWALAGRSASKLEQVLDSCGCGFGAAGARAGIIVADAGDRAALLVGNGKHEYASDFRYQEYMRFGKGVFATGTSMGMTLDTTRD